LRGRVVDARTGKPIAKVRVIISGTDLSTTTDDNGEFTFDNLPSGNVDLYLSNRANLPEAILQRTQRLHREETKTLPSRQ
jgi:hypothetical protein